MPWKHKLQVFVSLGQLLQSEFYVNVKPWWNIKDSQCEDTPQSLYMDCNWPFSRGQPSSECTEVQIQGKRFVACLEVVFLLKKEYLSCRISRRTKIVKEEYTQVPLGLLTLSCQRAQLSESKNKLGRMRKFFFQTWRLFELSDRKPDNILS